ILRSKVIENDRRYLVRAKLHLANIISALTISPIAVAQHFVSPVRRRLELYASATPAVRKVDFGDFRRSRPISRSFGLDRGTPIDRYYIEKFLAAHGADIKGRALEIGDASYCRRFGQGKITRQDVLHISPSAPEATIVGDLSHTGLLPP